MPRSVELLERASPDNFQEAAYLAANADVRAAVEAGAIASGRAHFDAFGRAEGRRQITQADVAELRREKLARLTPHLNDALPHRRLGDKYDFRPEAMREAETDGAAVSANRYDEIVSDLVETTDGLILDNGAGFRPVYYDNVVNFEIADYASTDVLGVGERLPFHDASFQAVISNAVLEHVRDPFACASEMARVLAPGGTLVANLAFLQPVHAYPHHYYNMTAEGGRALFEGALEIVDQRVLPSGRPVHTLCWIVNAWAAALPADLREDFLASPLSRFAVHAESLEEDALATALPEEAQFQLAASTCLIARKPG